MECNGTNSVVILSLENFGLVGSLPEAFGQLPELTVLALANNPRLVGSLPSTLGGVAHLLWMSVEDSGLVACAEPAAVPFTGPCTLPSSLVYADKYKPYATDSMLCPAALLTSFLAYTTDVPPDMWDVLTSPFPAPPTPGAGAHQVFRGCGGAGRDGGGRFLAKLALNQCAHSSPRPVDTRRCCHCEGQLYSLLQLQLQPKGGQPSCAV